MANQYGVQYKKAYVTTPYQNQTTNVAAATRSFVDWYVSGAGDAAINDGETLTLGIKLEIELSERLSIQTETVATAVLWLRFR